MKNPPSLPHSKKWKTALTKQFRFKYIDNKKDIPDNALWTTSCSKTKSGKKKGVPIEFYQGRYNLLFYKFMENYELDYGILSDKYGVHLADEKLNYYDIHPSKLSFGDKEKLGKKIRLKVKKKGFKEIVFYYPSPLQSKPYFDMLWFSKIPVYYISRIRLLEEKKE